MAEPVTLKVRGEGGVVFDMDLPEAGTVRREVFDDHVAKGLLTIIEGAVPAEDDGAAEGAGEPVDASADPAGDPAPVQPPRNASKDAWVDYAVALGADRNTVEQATRDGLVELYGVDEDDED